MFYIIFDFCMAAIMLLFGIWFYKSGGKAADYLSGYNMRSADERRKYDEDAIWKKNDVHVDPFSHWDCHRLPVSGNWLSHRMGDVACSVYSAAY